MPLLTACGTGNQSSNTSAPSTPDFCESPAPWVSEPEHGYVPLNYEDVTAEWFPYMRWEDILPGKSAEEFRSAAADFCSGAKSEGVNTLYLHVHPFCDAYYQSEIFPPGASWDGSFNPLRIMLEEAHRLGISVHAWLNPLRCQTPAQMSSLSSGFIVKRWLDDPQCSIVKEVGGRLWLDPSYPEIHSLLADCITEIAQNYDVDGFHIDDYFYPDSSPEFDRQEFLRSGCDDLAQWRLDNCSRMVKTMYDAVKSCDKRLQFGISPQGSINADYNSQFADVRLWSGTAGYCDYIVPQLYFGFENENCPFADVLSQWEDMVCDEVKLIVGLAPYKVGKADIWAGVSGENEWVDSPDIIERQINIVRSSSASGYALYY